MSIRHHPHTFLLALLTLTCMNTAPVFAKEPIAKNLMVDLRKTQANAMAEEWNNQGLFGTPVNVTIEPTDPDSVLLSSMHETFFNDGVCNVVVYVDSEHGTPTLPGLPNLAEHEHVLAFETIVAHELSHCAHFARGLRYENPTWNSKYNSTMSVQMVMAQQLYNETRFVDAHMEHVADAHAALKMRQKHKSSQEVDAFLAKYLGLRHFWLNVASSLAGPGFYVQHATQKSLLWGMHVPLESRDTPLQWFNRAVHEASIGALETSKAQVAWGGLGALVCATFSGNKEWSSVASIGLARIAANDMVFMPPEPWRSLPLDFKGAGDSLEKNRAVFEQTYGLHALQDLDALRLWVTAAGAQPIPLDADTIGKPEGVIPLDIAVGLPLEKRALKQRQANGCVATNPIFAQP